MFYFLSLTLEFFLFRFSGPLGFLSCTKPIAFAVCLTLCANTRTKLSRIIKFTNRLKYWHWTRKHSKCQEWQTQSGKPIKDAAALREKSNHFCETGWLSLWQRLKRLISAIKTLFLTSKHLTSVSATEPLMGPHRGVSSLSSFCLIK